MVRGMPLKLMHLRPISRISSAVATSALLLLFCCFLLLCSALFPFCYWLFSQFSVAINQYDSLVLNPCTSVG